MFLIHVVPSGPYDTNAIVIACSTSHQAAIIDPSPNSAAKLDQYLIEKQLTPKLVLLTHSHWDHIADAAEIKEKWGIPVAVHSADVPNLEKPGADGLPMFIPIRGVKADQLLAEGDEIAVGELQIQVIHTPGHSPGSVCFYLPQQGVLLSGDTLFKGTIGNLSFPTSQPDKMWSSLEKLQKLPPNTKVYPGHGPDTSLAKETWLSQAKTLFG